jgi:hypothetical protein
MDVERRSGLTVQDFVAEYVRPQRPVVITDIGASWRPPAAWTFEEMRRAGSDRLVMVDEGNVIQGDRPRVRMTLGAYLDMLTSGEAEERQLYLAGFDVFGCFPVRRAERRFALLDGKRLRYRRAWIGATGTGSGFHRDIADNVLVQVLGEKRVHLVSPADDASMYRTGRYEVLSDASAVDLDRWDPDRHPLYASADVAELVLRPGEGVFLPVNWWHATKALTTSISVNFGGATLLEAARHWRRFGAHALHLLRLHRWGNCACHPPVVEHQPDRRAAA